MDKISFDIFEPEKQKFKLTPNWIVLSLWTITILFLWIFDNVLPPNSTGRVAWLVCILIITMYYLTRSYFKYRPLKGSIKGEIIFESDSIVINGKVFALKDIEGLDFGFIDFYGEVSFINGDFNPKISQGVNNFVTFKDNTKQTQMVYFRMMTKNSSLTLYPFINEAVKLKAMSYYRAIDLIDIENVTKPE